MKRRTLEVYHARDGWRWRLIAANNRDIVADSGEAYRDRSKAMRKAFDLLKPNVKVLLHGRVTAGSRLLVAHLQKGGL